MTYSKYDLAAETLKKAIIEAGYLDTEPGSTNLLFDEATQIDLQERPYFIALIPEADFTDDVVDLLATAKGLVINPLCPEPEVFTELFSIQTDMIRDHYDTLTKLQPHIERFIKDPSSALEVMEDPNTKLPFMAAVAGPVFLEPEAQEEIHEEVVDLSVSASSIIDPSNYNFNEVNYAILKKSVCQRRHEESDTLPMTNAPEELRKDPLLQKLTVTCNGMALDSLPESARDDPSIVELAVAQDGWALQHASIRMRGDKRIVSTAVMNDPDAIEFAELDSITLKKIEAECSSNIETLAFPNTWADSGQLNKAIELYWYRQQFML